MDSPNKTRPIVCCLAGTTAWLSLTVCGLATMVGCARRPDPQDGLSNPSAMEQLRLASTTQQVEQLLTKLDDSDRHQLRQQLTRFQALPPSEKRRLRSQHQRISGSKSGSDLFRVLAQYRDWLAGLPEGQRADLLELPPKLRLEKIVELRSAEPGRDALIHPSQMTPDLLRQLGRWMANYLEIHKATLEQQLPGIPNAPSRDRYPRRQFGLLIQVAQNLDTMELPSPTPEQIEALRELVPSQPDLDRLSDEEFVDRVLPRMIANFSAAFQRRLPNRERLADFYERGLTTEERDRIDQLPADEAQREIRRLFMQREIRRGRPGDRRRENGRRSRPKSG